MIPTVLRIRLSRALKDISNWSLGIANYFDKLNSITKEENNIISRNAIFRNKHKGSRAFVIANGPSLSYQDIEPLKNEITFVANGFWKHPIISEQWQPTYYSFIDPNFFSSDPNNVNFFEEMNKRISNSTFFIPLFRGFENIKKNGFLDHKNTFYVAAYGEPFPSVDLTLLMQGFQSVSAFILAQAVYMGCSPIYLMGYDHNYLANRGYDQHFYEGDTISDPFKRALPLAERSTYDGEMEALIKLWRNYRSIKSVAERNGIEIFNATKGGYLDVFKRYNYEDISLT